MNSRILIFAALAIGVATGGTAFAQRDHRPEDRGHDDMHDRRDEPPGRGAPGVEPRRGGDRAHREEDRRNEERGAGPRHELHSGMRLPQEYRARYYVVEDWRGHHLHAPPRGYHWVQAGADYVLVAIPTGVITEIVISR